MDLLNLIRAQWDRAAAVGAVVLGGLALLFGYIGVSGTGYAAEQMPYIVSGGITGIFLLGIGATLYISADLRDEWRKLDEIEQHLVAVEEQGRLAVAALESPVAPRRSRNGTSPVSDLAAEPAAPVATVASGLAAATPAARPANSSRSKKQA